MTVPMGDRARAAAMVAGVFAVAAAVLVAASLMSGNSTPERTAALPTHAGHRVPAAAPSSPGPSPTEVLRNTPVQAVPVSQITTGPHTTTPAGESSAPGSPPGRTRPPVPEPSPKPTPVRPTPPPPVTACSAATVLTVRLPLGVLPCDTVAVGDAIKIGGTG